MSAKPENEREWIARIIARYVRPNMVQAVLPNGQKVGPASVGLGLAGVNEAADAIIAQRESRGEEPVAVGSRDIWFADHAHDIVKVLAHAKLSIETNAGLVKNLERDLKRVEDVAEMVRRYAHLVKAIAAAPPASQALAEPVETLAAAIYNANPCGDQETDLDGRPTGPGYLITWDQMGEYSPKEAAQIREVARLISEGRLSDFLGRPAEAQARVVELEGAIERIHHGYRVNHTSKWVHGVTSALLSGSTPKPARVEITEEMVERAHAIIWPATEWHEGENACRELVELALTAALTPSPSNAPETGYCKERQKPGGCQLHNLHCGYPACDRAPSNAGEG